MNKHITMNALEEKYKPFIDVIAVFDNGNVIKTQIRLTDVEAARYYMSQKWELRECEPMRECVSVCAQGNTYKRVTAQTVFGDKVIYATHKAVSKDGVTEMYYRVRKLRFSNGEIADHLEYFSPHFATWHGSFQLDAHFLNNVLTKI
jgi:hypothetical protein